MRLKSSSCRLDLTGICFTELIIPEPSPHTHLYDGPEDMRSLMRHDQETIWQYLAAATIEPQQTLNWLRPM